MTDSTIPTNIRRTWTVTSYGSYGDGAPVRLGSKTVIAQADAWGKRSAWIDGEPVPYEQAATLLSETKADGIVELIAEEYPFAGKAAAYEVHRRMGELGYRRHYEVAAEVLGREVTSFANLLPDELKLVRHYAFGQLGLVG